MSEEEIVKKVERGEPLADPCEICEVDDHRRLNEGICAQCFRTHAADARAEGDEETALWAEHMARECE